MRHQVAVSLGALVALGLALGCSHGPFECSAASQCLDHGVQGQCESQGFCSFPDTECPSGDRFEPKAGAGLAGTCVPPGNEDPDAGTCGGIGMACCPSTATACGGNAFCDAGTCKQCTTGITFGHFHSCALRHDGTVWCAGDNTDGELGTGAVGGLPSTTWVQARDSTNAVIGDATAIGGGGHETCVVRAGGALWCWGRNDTGAVGDGTFTRRSTAVPVLRESDNMPLTGIVEIQGGHEHTCARDTGGMVWCWGDNDGGRLGDGDPTGLDRNRAAPVLTSPGGPPFVGALELAVGHAHACARKGADELWCWGENLHGQVGDNTRLERSVPVQVLTATSVAAGRFHTCAVKPDGTVWCWGQGNQGRLGNGLGDKDSGDSLDRLTPIPALTSLGGTPFDNAARVAASASSCAITTAGDAYCWGVNLYGQTATAAGSYVPSPVLKLDGNPLRSVARIVTRFTHSCAFLTSGELVCWGRNSEGELGDGTLVNQGRATPIKLTCP